MTDRKFPVITICGSMRFHALMLRAAGELTRDGYIVLMPFVGDYVGGRDADDIKLMLDEMHKRKIDMSDRIVVVTDLSHYVGESTLSEMRYAAKHKKWIDWYSVDRYFKSDTHGIEL